MKKISLLTKTAFYISNIGLILTYLYPGSIFGLMLYGDIKRQPQLTSDFIIFSSNHVYAFMVLSLLGVISYINKKGVRCWDDTEAVGKTIHMDEIGLEGMRQFHGMEYETLAGYY